MSKNENVFPILFNQFSSEVRFAFNSEKISRMLLNKASKHSLWVQAISKKSQIACKNNIIEIKIPFEDLNISENEFSFCIVDSTNELINDVYPQDILININL